MSIEVYDNFLPEEVFTPIRDYVFGGRMPWYYASNSVKEGGYPGGRNGKAGTGGGSKGNGASRVTYGGGGSISYI